MSVATFFSKGSFSHKKKALLILPKSPSNVEEKDKFSKIRARVPQKFERSPFRHAKKMDLFFLVNKLFFKENGEISC
jgi:hypothetical protein